MTVNNPFKDIMRRKWQEWMLSGNHTFTASGRKQLSATGSEAWKEMPEQLIKKLFLKWSITNCIDGTEDDILWQDDENATDNKHLPKDDGKLLYADENEVASCSRD